MDRTVPRTGSEEIELYIRTYYSLLRSTADVKIRTLEEVHGKMASSLHPQARAAKVDMPALVYSALRLPLCIAKAERILLGQSQEVFQKGGYGEVEGWNEATTKARRRRGFFDGEETLAFYVSSRSDIDDIIPMLTAFQMEWNKLHYLMRGEQVRSFIKEPVDTREGRAILAAGIGVDPEDLESLYAIWDPQFWEMMEEIVEHPKNIRVNLLASSLNDYRRATQSWWNETETTVPSISQRPVYFISSNPHSIVNLVTGFALRNQEEITRFLEEPKHKDLLDEWMEIEARNRPSSRENFLYYALKKQCASPEGKDIYDRRAEAERLSGITRIKVLRTIDIETQIIELASVRAEWVDPRISRADLDVLKKSDALIVNVDYPLGMAAYLVLSQVASRVGKVLGIYVVGKAATLNGVIGDVMIPDVVHDEHSQNTYLFENCFRAESFGEDLVYGTALDNQKAVTVRGTFLQNPKYMDVFYREGYTDIEMEAGAYLSAVYELYRPTRYPNNEVINLHGIPFDMGVIHYASDTPLSKGGNLGTGSLSYFGMDPSYASCVAILRRVFEQEIHRLKQSER